MFPSWNLWFYNSEWRGSVVWQVSGFDTFLTLIACRESDVTRTAVCMILDTPCRWLRDTFLHQTYSEFREFDASQRLKYFFLFYPGASHRKVARFLGGQQLLYVSLREFASHVRCQLVKNIYLPKNIFFQLRARAVSWRHGGELSLFCWWKFWRKIICDQLKHN